MENNTDLIKNDITPVRLRLELKDDYLTDYQRRMLARYGESRSGNSIIRDILVPFDMPLHNLHYAIQRLFGWQNSHLRSFYLPEEIYEKLTDNTVKGWSDLVGILFQPPSEGEGDLFWDDDYDGGNFKVWLRKKYTGPYIYEGNLEVPEIAKKDIEELLDHYSMVDVRESFHEYLKRKNDGGEDYMRILKRAPLIDLTIDEMHDSIILEWGSDYLLERLEVDKVLAAQGEDMDSTKLFPLTKELIYNYDFGDDWVVKITKYDNCNDLIEQNLIADNELRAAQEIVLYDYKPVCLHKEGLSVLDDVGGLGGFADFLGRIYENEDKSEASDYRAWAKSLGWRPTKTSIHSMI